VSVTDEGIIIEYCIRGIILTGENKIPRENLHQCHFVDNKSHMDWSGTKPGPWRVKIMVKTKGTRGIQTNC